jgi:hypothetical protein
MDYQRYTFHCNCYHLSIQLEYNFQRALKDTVLPNVVQNARLNNYLDHLLERILIECLYQILAIHCSSLGHNSSPLFLIHHNRFYKHHHNHRVQKVHGVARTHLFDHTLAQACSHRLYHNLHIQYRIGWLANSIRHLDLANKPLLAKPRMYRFVSNCQSHP